MRVLVAVALLTLGAAGCSGKDDSAGPDVAGPSPATDGTGPVVASVVSTTTTTTTTAPTTVAPSSAPPTIAAPLTTAGPATGPYQPTTAPTFPSRSTAPPADGLPDGSYYAVVRGAAADAPTPRVATTIYQLLTGPEAIAAAQAAGHGLDSDIFVPEQPAADRDIELRPDLFISVARPDRPDVSYAISASELARLVNGGAPSAGAPDGYRYVPFPYLITVAGGVPTRLEQLWAP
jgi:hypothetical protein